MIEYRSVVEGIDASWLNGFFEGWPRPPSAETHLRLLRSSAHVVLACDSDARRVVGFVTAVSDGVLAAYIPLLEVLPSHRDRGIARELVRRIFSELEHLYMVDLCCDPGLRPFYEGLGMTPVAGMALRNYANQAGTGASEAPKTRRR